MLRTFAKLSCSLLLMLTTVTNIGCGLSVLKQTQEASSVETQAQSVFTILNIKDVQGPKRIVGSVVLPFATNPYNNTTVSGQNAYVTTNRHLHVIDLANQQNPTLITSIEFPNVIGHVKSSGDYIFVASDLGLYVVDITNAHQPRVVQSPSSSATHLSMPIKDFDIRQSYIYIIDANHYLHILDLSSLPQLDFVQSIPISPSWLLCIRSKGASAQLIQLPYSPSFSPEIWKELLNRKNLLELSSRYDKLRVSNNYLAFVDLKRTGGEVTVVIARENKLPFPTTYGKFQYYMEGHYLAHLYLTGEKIFKYPKPTDAHVDSQGNVVLIAQDQWAQTISTKTVLGRITDLQVTGHWLYVTHLNGFLSIINLVEGETRPFVAAINLAPYRPISVALHDEYAYLLCDSNY